MKPEFRAGRNIAMKVPPHEYTPTIAFYRDILGFALIPGGAASSTESVRFAFGDQILWIDRAPGLSQAEIWLEIVTDDPDAAAAHLARNHCVRRDEIEPLPEGFKGFWIASPANVIHLVAVPEDT